MQTENGDRQMTQLPKNVFLARVYVADVMTKQYVCESLDDAVKIQDHFSNDYEDFHDVRIQEKCLG